MSLPFPFEKRRIQPWQKKLQEFKRIMLPIPMPPLLNQKPPW